MPDELHQKFEELLGVLSRPWDGPPSAAERGLLIVYPPEEEPRFGQLLAEYLLQMRVKGIAHVTVDVEPLAFECLEREGLLADALRLEVEDPKSLKQYLAAELSELVFDRVMEVGKELGKGAIILKSPTAAFPWVSYDDLLKRLPAGFPCCVVVPFPGHEREGHLSFLCRKPLHSYLARRL